MRKRKWVPVEQLPDPDPGVLNKMIADEEAPKRNADAARLLDLAAALKAECRKLSIAEQALVAAYLMDVLRMTSAEVADLLGRTKEWVRVNKLFARRRFPCSGGPSSCAVDQPACAHKRGRRLCNMATLKAMNP